MNTFVLGLALLASATAASDENPRGRSAAAAATAPPSRRIGQIFVVGNEFTRHSVILNALDFFPGQKLYYPDLRRSERNLERLGIFKSGSVHIMAEDDPNNPDSDYRNVFVSVEETPTWSVMLTPSVNCQGMPVFSFVWEERNFDPLRFPISWDELRTGGAFRGGGQFLRLELLQIPVAP